MDDLPKDPKIAGLPKRSNDRNSLVHDGKSGEEEVMKKLTIVFAVSILPLLGLFSGAALADQSCRQVQANVTGLSEVFTGSNPICNGYDLCQYADIRGTLNGRWWSFWDLEDEELVADFTAFVFATDTVFKTNRGEVYGQERGILNFFANDAFVSHIGVTGGTDAYEGATGWIGAVVTYFSEAGGKLMGEICTNGD